jgi:hypothetical protein
MADGVQDLRDHLLDPAYAAAHRALGRLEDDEVPAQLRSIRAASRKKSLPRPFRVVLARALEEEWLRTLAAAELTDADSPADRASRLFLTRPDGWEEEVARIVASDAERSRLSESESLQAENLRLGRLLEELSERLRQSEARLKSAQRDSTGDERVETLRRRLEAEIRARKAAERAVGESEAEIARLRTEIGEADERITVLRGRVNRSPGRAAESPRTNQSFGRGSPLETARLLDELVETMRPPVAGEPDQSERTTLSLPAGVRPDSVASVEWIKTIERPVLLLVDGHNVAHDFAPDPGRAVRDRIVSATAGLRRLADGALSAVVFFDSTHADESYRNFGVSVRFVGDADDAIVEAAAGAEIDCIVISTDRQVRARAGEHGALALWGTAFSDWIKRR